MCTMFIILLLLSILSLLMYNYYVHYEKFRQLINLIPGPSGSLIFGNLFEFFVSEEEQWKVLHTLTDKYYPISKIWFFFTPIVFIRHPNDLKIILSSTKPIEKSKMYNLLHPWLGTGLLTSTVKKKPLALLDLLITISREEVLTDLDIKEEVDTFMFEGHDTTAMGITFALLLLAEHKDIQERVRFEINTIMQENEGKLTMKSLQNLLYLNILYLNLLYLKETLRLYPSVFLISRNAAEDVKLQSYIIPAGTMIQIDIYNLHRDPNFWLNPEVFDPDRFLSEKIQNRHPYSYLPFSAGSRNCIGQQFAILEMKAIIASLIYNFYLEPVDYVKNVRLKTGIIIRPVNSIRIKFVSIKK